MSEHQIGTQANQQKLKRSLKSRHIAMISLGGTIGTGLFLASGASIAQAGPGGVPIYALLATLAIGCLAFLSSFFSEGIVYLWLLNASGLSGFIAWVGIAVSHYRFRKAFLVQGLGLDRLPYKARFYPFGPIFAFLVCLIVIVGQNYTAFIGGSIDWYGVAVSYIGIPLFLILWFGYKIKHKTKIVPLEECDLDNK